jgi:hypothetical protein
MRRAGALFSPKIAADRIGKGSPRLLAADKKNLKKIINKKKRTGKKIRAKKTFLRSSCPHEGPLEKTKKPKTQGFNLI